MELRIAAVLMCGPGLPLYYRLCCLTPVKSAYYHIVSHWQQLCSGLHMLLQVFVLVVLFLYRFSESDVYMAMVMQYNYDNKKKLYIWILYVYIAA